MNVLGRLSSLIGAMCWVLMAFQCLSSRYVMAFYLLVCRFGIVIETTHDF